MPCYLFHLLWSTVLGIICCKSPIAEIFAKMEEIVQDPFNRTVRFEIDNNAPAQPKQQQQVVVQENIAPPPYSDP